MRYAQIFDHEWFRISRGKRIACCDCGLVHLQELRITGRFIEMRLSRDDRATAAARRGKGLAMTKVRKDKASKAKASKKAKKAPAVTHEETAAALAGMVRHAETVEGNRDVAAVVTARDVLNRLHPEEAKLAETIRVGEVAGEVK